MKLIHKEYQSFYTKSDKFLGWQVTWNFYIQRHDLLLALSRSPGLPLPAGAELGFEF
jgi:hypothetical protein